jgi:hypothetical protein
MARTVRFPRSSITITAYLAVILSSYCAVERCSGSTIPAFKHDAADGSLEITREYSLSQAQKVIQQKGRYAKNVPPNEH